MGLSGAKRLQVPIPLTFSHLLRELLQLPTLPIGVLYLLQLLKPIPATKFRFSKPLPPKKSWHFYSVALNRILGSKRNDVLTIKPGKCRRFGRQSLQALR